LVRESQQPQISEYNDYHSFKFCRKTGAGTIHYYQSGLTHYCGCYKESLKSFTQVSHQTYTDHLILQKTLEPPCKRRPNPSTFTKLIDTKAPSSITAIAFSSVPAAGVVRRAASSSSSTSCTLGWQTLTGGPCTYSGQLQLLGVGLQTTSLANCLATCQANQATNGCNAFLFTAPVIGVSVCSFYNIGYPAPLVSSNFNCLNLGGLSGTEYYGKFFLTFIKLTSSIV
jgi:hypothetical protein